MTFKNLVFCFSLPNNKQWGELQTKMMKWLQIQSHTHTHFMTQMGFWRNPVAYSASMIMALFSLSLYLPWAPHFMCLNKYTINKDALVSISWVNIQYGSLFSLFLLSLFSAGNLQVKKKKGFKFLPKNPKELHFPAILSNFIYRILLSKMVSVKGVKWRKWGWLATSFSPHSPSLISIIARYIKKKKTPITLSF